MKTDKEIGKRLIQLRKEKKESREELANSLGISLSCLIKYECGFRHITDVNKEKIANHFSKSISEVFYEF